MTDQTNDELRPIVIRDGRDFDDLPYMTRLEVVRALKQIQLHPEEGERLHAPKYETALLGDLSKYGCRSWRTSGSYYDSARVVYRILDDGTIDVVAVGLRFKSAAFIKAWQRLKPPEGKPRRFRPFR